MELTVVLKAISDETRMKIIRLLLEHDYCVRGLAKRLNISESAVSQHVKVLKELDILIGNKRGYYIHYEVDRLMLHAIAKELEQLANIKSEGCNVVSEKTCKNERCQCQLKKS